VNSYNHGDASTGMLTSPEFEITKPFLNFLIGGGSQKTTRMDLLVGGRVVRTASGKDAERLAWASWDVREFLNQKAVLQIVDQATGGWGHINVDQITLADAPAHPASEAAQWFDYGPDYYAAVSWSDVPKSDGRRLWIGWMNNWEYGQAVPTAPWRSTMSIPREVGLRRIGGVIQLVQKPARELESLRDHHYSMKGGDMAAANAWISQNQIAGQQLELVVDFPPESLGTGGVKVLDGAGEATVIGVDRDRGRVFVDRTQSGVVNFDPKFSGVYDAPLASPKAKVSLHIFVDAGSVEVFANDGERVFTDLVFPSASSRNVEFFGTQNDARISSLNAWTLKSVWK
jgi:sucrose-6-phosphate hydrolase SacC (GH32 family)